jgi:hypothetical protein
MRTFILCLSIQARNRVIASEEKLCKTQIGTHHGTRTRVHQKETGDWKAVNLILVDVWLACFGDVDINDNWTVSDILLRT